MLYSSPGSDNEAIHELRDELKDLNNNLKRNSKETDHLNKILLVFTVIQVMIGMYQVLIAVLSNNINRWVGISLIFLLVIIVYAFFRWADKNIIDS